MLLLMDNWHLYCFLLPCYDIIETCNPFRPKLKKSPGILLPFLLTLVLVSEREVITRAHANR